MTAVFGKMEMFHATVDELWHIMLDDKQKYDRFCRDFLGQMILHHPHTEPVFKPVERTLFDFYYVQLFTIDSPSILTWGKFFKHDKATSNQKYNNIILRFLQNSTVKLHTKSAGVRQTPALSVRAEITQQPSSLQSNRCSTQDDRLWAGRAHVPRRRRLRR